MTKYNLKTSFRLALISLLFFSCQANAPKADAPVAVLPTDAKPVKAFGATPPPPNYNLIIKSDKKKQSDLDLPFRGFEPDKQITSIATGSCADQDQPQPIWKTIESNNPNLFIFSGDTLYASSPTQKPISEQYRKLKLIPEYRSIREKVPFMAIWDDHDFGINDGGSTNPEKEVARTEFLKQWSYLKFSLPPKQKALYHSKIFGSKKQKVQIIMLDTRWDRSDLTKNPDDKYDPNSKESNNFPRPYIADTDKTKHFLSQEQWAWLEHELKQPAELRLLVSSIQVIPDDHNFEKWGNFPNEKEKLLALIQKTKAKNLIILSGDRHMASIARTDIKKTGPIYEMTSSGLNKPTKPGNIISDKTYLADGYGPVNFGLILINWDKRIATLQVKSLENEVKSSVEVKF
ncbi:MAG: alkaline phosphatase D family protein [Pseudobdellovibrio sp.]